MANEKDYVEIGLYCANVCRTLDRGLIGRKLDGLGPSVLYAIGHLTT